MKSKIHERLEKSIMGVSKKTTTIRLAVLPMILSGLFLTRVSMAQDKTQERIIDDSKSARASFLKTDPSMENLFKHSAGYAIFPNVGKGGAGLGAAAGNGAVHDKGVLVGTAEMTQVTAGLQAGGQAYREVIFFENQEALDRFMHNKVEFSGQASAIAVKAGASANANYRNGVVVFSQEKGGLMLEASLGGQKFAYKTLK